MNDDTKTDGELSEVEILKQQLAESEAKAAEYLDGWQRSKADFINARKEEDKSRGEMIKYATSGLMSDLIGVLDSFNLAMINKEVWEKIDKGWRTGVEYIYHQLVGVLKDNGMAEVGSVGDKLDLGMHQPIEEIETDDDKLDHTIAEVFQKGYKIGDKIIRPAHVKVYKLKVS
ncbi:MAG: nucleotide exchange factor GrpE [Candidatus Paceibacterota bacterium]|jgi:molecular chaperone GrpE